ncbi:MAG: DUF1492 domain-containing protein [Ruminococcaceae bacterium]|nr:DUF1492 domain-containing protein [Oscillospiraceae bacterium]
MTIQQAKRELLDYRQDAEEIKERKDEIRVLESRLYSGCGGNLENGVIALITLKDHYVQRVNELINKRIEIEEKIACLPQPYRNVLYLYYIRNLSLIQIAARLYYEYTYVSKLHTKALELYARAYGQKIA